jgi:hypothetical protein
LAAFPGCSPRAHTNKASLEAYLASYGGLQRAPGQISGKFRRQRPP